MTENTLQTREQILAYAVKDKRQLEDVIAVASHPERLAGPIVLYHVCGIGEHAHMDEFVVTNKARIVTTPFRSEVIYGTGSETGNWRDHHFLMDVNIGAHYNENYLFTNKKAAEAWVKFCKNDAEIVERQRKIIALDWAIDD